MNDPGILIIDDEATAIKTLLLMIEHYLPDISNIKATTDPAEGLILVKNFKPQLLFIDIQMPSMNGFELLRQIPRIDFDIIFTTAHDEYAIEAIRFSALDYLLKPIDADELQNAYQRFIEKRSHKKESQALYKNFVYNLNVKERSEFKLALPTLQGTFSHKPSDIIRLEGEGNYTRFFFSNAKSLLTTYTLKSYEEVLVNHGFIRIHKSHLINRDHVVNYMADGMLTMSDHSRVEISRRRKDEVMETLRNKD